MTYDHGGFFANQRVLITGISGFVGQHLAQRLASYGAEVYGIARTAHGPHMFSADVSDFAAVDLVIKECGITLCYHLAARALVEIGQNAPHAALSTNINGTLNVLESCRVNQVSKVVVASTAHVYGDYPPPFIEAMTPIPTRPYETSKACADLIAQTYAATYDLPVLIPRIVNIYGPGDRNFSRLVPRIMRSLISGNPMKMWGGAAVRDFLFIDDAIDAYVHLGVCDSARLDSNRVFNFGAGNLISVNDLLARVGSLAGRPVPVERVPDERTREIQTQYVSWEKARQVLEWHPRVTLDEGLMRTIEWYSNAGNWQVEPKTEETAGRVLLPIWPDPAVVTRRGV